MSLAPVLKFPLLERAANGVPADNLLIYGMTGSGKTTQLAELIRAMATPDMPALVYVSDKGGAGAYTPLARKGLVLLEPYRDGDRFIWLSNAAQGNRFVEGKWVKTDLSKISLIVYDSLSGTSDLILNQLGKLAAEGKNVGGEPAPGLKIQAEGQEISVASGSRTHYLVAQRHLLEKVWQSQTHECPVAWAAHEDIVPLDKKSADGEKSVETVAGMGVRGIIGPAAAGSALTKELPKYFVYTFRLATNVTESVKKHHMFTGRHRDGNLEGLANSRSPLKSSLPLKVDPTDLVATLRKIQEERNA